VAVYRWVYVLIIPVGATLSLKAVWSFCDIFTGLMAFPNLVALVCLSGPVARATREYFADAYESRR